jgi:hypothetical protein
MGAATGLTGDKSIVAYTNRAIGAIGFLAPMAPDVSRVL